MFILSLLLLAGLVVLYFWKGRDLLAKYLPGFAALKDAHDALFLKWFGASRTLLVSRVTAAVGYVMSALDVLPVLLDAVDQSGMAESINSLMPSKLAAVGPVLLLVGHVYSALRRVTTDSLSNVKANAEVAAATKEGPAA